MVIGAATEFPDKQNFDGREADPRESAQPQLGFLSVLRILTERGADRCRHRRDTDHAQQDQRPNTGERANVGQETAEHGDKCH